MALLVRDISKRGWASLNVGYRRVGRFGGGGGWPATFHDVRDAIDALQGRPGIDSESVVVVGHSAGGHLALWAVKEAARPPLGVVSMAGVADLEPSWHGGDQAVRALIEAAPADERFALTSPRQRRPLGVPILCVHGGDDTTVRPAMSTDFVDAASQVGDDARVVIVPGEAHRDPLRPSSAIWAAAIDAIEGWLAPS